MSEESPERRGPVLENRLPAEGINSSREHPLKEFAWLMVASGVTLLVLMALASWGARWLAPKLPFSVEVALAQRLFDQRVQPQHAARTAALQRVADQVVARMSLPEGMAVVLTYSDSPLVNAYATVGGRIQVFNGLLQELHSEEALAALLAHEIAHVKHRHVASSLGRGLAIALLLSAVSTDAGAAAAESALGNAAGFTMLGYSREQEAQADDEALQAVVALHGHAGGLIELFTRLGQAEKSVGPKLEALNTHPLTEARLAAVQAHARERGWAISGGSTPLPDAFKKVGK
ncbi:MAG: M48 family metallopeptidase [Cytophagales bacterium]|nr:M48 family metallopeptidase [Rhizobacter sp.]